MPKIYSILTSLLICSFFLSLGTKSTSAQAGVGLCNNPNVQTDPNPLKNTDPKGDFIIDINRTKQEQDAVAAGKTITGWKVEFQCAAVGKEQKDATKELGDTNIKVTLDKSVVNSGVFATNICEFDPKNNPNTVLVKAVLNGNTDVPFCRASYLVYDADAFCELEMTPDKNIIFGTRLEVKVKEVASEGNFNLFVDDNPVSNPARIGEENQSVRKGETYQLPQDRLTHGTHQVSLRKFTFDPLLSLGPLEGPRAPSLGGPLCPIAFNVGTKDNPGSVTSVTTGTSAHVPCPPGQCSSSVVDSCNVTGQKGIPTAIGCIPTEPVALTTTLLKFLVAIAGGIAFLLMVLGAFGMITSAGNPENLEASKDRFSKAVIGLLTVVFAVLLLKVIGVDILGLGAFLGV